VGRSLRVRSKERFQQAFQICRAQLVRHGYLQVGSEDGAGEKIKLTPKGLQREREHRREGPQKARAFDTLYASFIGEREKGKPAPKSDQPKSDQPTPDKSPAGKK